MNYTPKHSRPYSELRELNVPEKSPRHRYDRTHERLGADAFDLGELLHDVCVKPRRVLQGLS